MTLVRVVDNNGNFESIDNSGLSNSEQMKPDIRSEPKPGANLLLIQEELLNLLSN